MRGVLFRAKGKCAVFYSVLRAPGAVFYSMLRKISLSSGDYLMIIWWSSVDEQTNKLRFWSCDHLLIIWWFDNKQTNKEKNFLWSPINFMTKTNKQTNKANHLVIIWWSSGDHYITIYYLKKIISSDNLLIIWWSSIDNMTTNKHGLSSDDHLMIIYYLTTNKQTKLII